MTRRTTLTALLIATMTTMAFAGNRNSTRQVHVPKKKCGGHHPGQVHVPYQVQTPGYGTRQVVIDNCNGTGQSLAYFSNRLGARFLIQSIQIGNYAPVMAARIVSDPMAGSPLAQLGLTTGDVITRLDGIPVTNTAELERHIFDTKVRFVRAGSQFVSEGQMWVDQNRYFHETQYPAYTYNTGNPGGGGLRP